MKQKYIQNQKPEFTPENNYDKENKEKSEESRRRFYEMIAESIPYFSFRWEHECAPSKESGGGPNVECAQDQNEERTEL